MSNSMSISDTLERLKEKTSGHSISLGEVVEKLENKGFGPILLVPALIAFLPTGVVPGIPSTCGILIFLITIQMALGKKHPWIPSRLKKVTFNREKLISGINNAKPFTDRLDKWFKPRLTFFTAYPINRLVALTCGLFGLAMIPLELLPFAVALPALAILLAAIGLMTEDGILILLATFLLLGTLYLVIHNLVK